MKAFRFSLGFAFLASLLFLLFLTWLLLSLISYKTAENDLLGEKRQEARLLLGSLLTVIPRNVADAAHDATFARFTERLMQDGDVSSVVLVDAVGAGIFARPSTENADQRLRETVRMGEESLLFSSDGKFLIAYAPIKEEERVAGAARLSLTLARQRARLDDSRNLFLAYFLLDSLLLVGIGYFMLRRTVSIPLDRLLSATQRVTAGDYEQRVHVPGPAEVAELAASFNVMVSALQAKRQEVDDHVRSLENANSELKAAREEAVRSEKMASVGLLAAGTAHEIGTPLAAIIGFAGILRDEVCDDPRRLDFMCRIEDEAFRIDRIVRGLLDYARPSTAALEMVRVNVVVSSAIDLLAAQGVLKGLRLTLGLEDELPPIAVDRHELQQVLVNLLLNARDAVPAGGEVRVETRQADPNEFPGYQAPAPPVRVMGRRREDFHGAFCADYPRSDTGSWVIIAIADNGIGIPSEDLGRIFDPFFTTKEPGEGTGLGLSICARIIDSFGGRIVAQSEEGSGSTFFILLPVPASGNAGKENG
ncbi:sensor histidine kinase [Geobacter sp. DSM 9736]|uniref:sensor histidine kinase n=1 Tax=Geobacter sp. DSM 9736 TaxID=1277350 RepID=UPI000B50C334|nr:HAMP domain-containing sensor histidine kinase [Geobacter sp. DSM 9736]SNB46203.1 hypothetical protein SAMN06269301_1647 [Geobacter sp. DSM 9736]